MTDHPKRDAPKGDAEETPMARALRLKQAALEAKQKPPGAGKVRREGAGMAPGASKPWMKK